MLHITGGYLIEPRSGTEGYHDILIKNNEIAYISQPGIPLSDMLKQAGLETEDVKTDSITHIDTSGKIVAPGLVDVHVHFRDPGFTYKEDIESGAKAAAKGGYTSVVLMANTKPAVDNVETLKYVLEKGAKTGINVYTCANVTLGMKGEKLTDMETLAGNGAAGFTDDGVPVMDEELLREALRKAAALGKPVSLHEENPRYIKNNGINAGLAARHYGIEGSPREAEISMVERDIKIAVEEAADLSIQHISTKEAVELVRKAKRHSCHIFTEATPHHFTLTEEAAVKYGTLAKMNPPLREEADKAAIIEGLKDGTIDMIATDHAPHSSEEKSKSITEAPSGIIGLETALSLGIRELVNPGYLTMLELIRKMTSAPADFYKLDAGYIEKGGPADLVIFDRNAEWTVEADRLASKSANSPFIGETLPGVVEYTICGGEVVYARHAG